MEPEGIQATRDARAKAVMQQPVAVVLSPPRGTSNQTLHVIAHLEHTPMKITYGTFFKEAPECCEYVIRELQKNLKSSDPELHLPQKHPYQQMSLYIPMPLKPTSLRYRQWACADGIHLGDRGTMLKSANATVWNAVVRGDVDILGRTSNCIADTGASDTVCLTL